MPKNQILVACREIIREHGIQHLLMDDVARRCGVSKKTIYEQFGNKEALLELLGISFFGQEGDAFLAGLQQQRQLPDKIEFIIHHLLNLGELIPVEELEFLKKKFRINHQMLKAYIDKVLEQLQILLQEAQAQGKVYADLNLGMHTWLLLGQLQYLHVQHRFLIQQHPMPHWRQQLITSFLRATLLS